MDSSAFISPDRYATFVPTLGNNQSAQTPLCTDEDKNVWLTEWEAYQKLKLKNIMCYSLQMRLRQSQVSKTDVPLLRYSLFRDIWH